MANSLTLIRQLPIAGGHFQGGLDEYKLFIDTINTPLYFVPLANITSAFYEGKSQCFALFGWINSTTADHTIKFVLGSGGATNTISFNCLGKAGLRFKPEKTPILVGQMGYPATVETDVPLEAIIYSKIVTTFEL
jgi:hypothetical protein